MNRTRFLTLMLCAVGLLALLGCVPAQDLCDVSELTVPAIVVSLAPSETGITDDLTPELPWSASYDCAIDGFRVEVALDGDFTAPGVLAATTGPEVQSWTPASDLEPASSYQWRVAAVSGGVIGPYTRGLYFFTGPACGEDQRWLVDLESPAMGEVVSDDNPPLAWSYPDGSCIPENYAFTVQEQPAGTNSLTGQSGPYTGFSTGISYLDDCTRYHWWVQPVIGGVASENYRPAYFVTNFDGTCPGAPCDASTLVAPTPLAPADGAAWSGTYPIVTWDYAYPACAPNLLFHAQVARDEAFTDLVAFTENVPGGWMTFDPAAAQLDDCSTYYWRVAAEVGGTVGPYSETWSFHTDFNATCPGSPCDVTALPAPTPVSPAEGADWSGTFPIVTWDYPHPDCESAILFHAEIARDSRFTDWVVHSENIPGQSNTFDPAAATLNDCTTYYWHVAATSANGHGPFSETRTFRTNFVGACGRSSRGTISQDAVCRGGPSLDHPIALYLSRGAEVELTGRNEEGTWLALTRPDGYGSCWVGAQLVTTSNDLAALPVQEAPPAPLPTPIPVSCSSFGDASSCQAAGCQWVQQFIQQGPWICVP